MHPAEIIVWCAEGKLECWTALILFLGILKPDRLPPKLVGDSS